MTALDALNRARAAWQRQDQQTAFDFDALNAASGPETARDRTRRFSPPGRSVEDVGDGLGNGGTPASSQATKQGEAA